MEKDKLLEWYEQGPGPVEVELKNHEHGYGHEEPEQKQEPEQEEKPAEDIEKLGEMYKAMAFAKAIESKLTAYSFKENDEDKKKIKTSIKEMTKKLGEVVDTL